jgi:hypothetical protein
MTIVIVVLAAMFGYLGVGMVLARLALADVIKAATRYAGETYTEERYIRRENVGSYKTVTMTRRENSINRQVVYDTSRAILFGWPVVYWWFYFNRDIRKALDKVDPPINREHIAAMEAEAAEQAAGQDLEVLVR